MKRFILYFGAFIVPLIAILTGAELWMRHMMIAYYHVKPERW
jgi:hypothetical protein